MHINEITKILLEKSGFEEIEGVRFLPNAGYSARIVEFDEFDIEDEGNRYTKKGQIKRYEVENFKDEYDIDLPVKKSDFPFIMYYKNRKYETNFEKVKIIKTLDNGSDTVIKVPKQPKDTLAIHFGNENTIGFIYKDDLDKFLELENKNFKSYNKIYSKMIK